MHVIKRKVADSSRDQFFLARVDCDPASAVMSRRPFGDSKGLDDAPDKSLYDPFNLPSSTARPGPRHGRSSSPGLLGKFGLAQPSLHMYVIRGSPRSGTAPRSLFSPFLTLSDLIGPPSLHLARSLVEDVFFLHPTPEGMPSDDEFVRGTVTLYLP